MGIGRVMIKVLFFARLREQLGINELLLEPISGETVLALAKRLRAQQSEEWDVLLDEETVYAMNQDIVERNTVVADGAEVAFFPPVTGG